ncbi:unnamed protein product [Litomosoides sigmodontis]|uniref:Uncharacterized protein n=1 Tax=Litomosoides sigmodontis TaxID=42156 RepID=A0A3P6TMF7_LITSI|nr:unnamed protein product [Litomosoides sigmodontis]
MYNEIDECLNEYDGRQAYQLIKEIKTKEKEGSVELEYRLAHACYILSNFCLSKENERYQLLYEAYLSCKWAWKLEPRNAEVLKWSAIISGTLAELKNLSDSERVTYVREFKKFLDEALTTPPDSSIYHMNGRFCYRIATLSEKEKECVAIAFDSLPLCTIDDALDNFHKAEELSSGHVDNHLYLSKCYIAKGNYTEAQKYLMHIIKIVPSDQADEAMIAEAQELLADIEKIQDENERNENSHEPEIGKTANSHSEEESNAID